MRQITKKDLMAIFYEDENGIRFKEDMGLTDLIEFVNQELTKEWRDMFDERNRFFEEVIRILFKRHDIKILRCYPPKQGSMCLVSWSTKPPKEHKGRKFYASQEYYLEGFLNNLQNETIPTRNTKGEAIA